MNGFDTSVIYWFLRLSLWICFIEVMDVHHELVLLDAQAFILSILGPVMRRNNNNNNVHVMSVIVPLLVSY